MVDENDHKKVPEMLADSWLLFCIVASFLASLSFGINAHFKANGILLSFWRSAITTLVLLPIIFFVEWPQNPYFYVFAGLTATVGVVSDMFMYKAVSEHGSGPCLRLLNLRIPLGVVLGWIIFPASWFALGQSPYIFTGVMWAIILCGLSLFYMQKSALGKAATMVMLLPVTLYVITDILQKQSILYNPDPAGILMFLFFMCFVMLIVSALVCLFYKKTWIEPHIFKHAAWVSGIWLTLVAVKTAAMIGIPNPGYFSVFIGLSAVWAMLYNKWRQIPDHANPIAGGCLVLGAVLLAYFVSLVS
jgi:hypothetical protein